MKGLFSNTLKERGKATRRKRTDRKARRASTRSPSLNQEIYLRNSLKTYPGIQHCKTSMWRNSSSCMGSGRRLTSTTIRTCSTPWLRCSTPTIGWMMSLCFSTCGKMLQPRRQLLMPLSLRTSLRHSRKSKSQRRRTIKEANCCLGSK